MYSIDEIIEKLSSLETENLNEALHYIIEFGTGDQRVINLLEKLMSDRRLVRMIAYPSPEYGEMRWLAARALATERYITNRVDDIVILSDSFSPMKAGDILYIINSIHPSYLAQGKTITEKDVFEWLQELIQTREIPQKNQYFFPRKPYSRDRFR